MCSEYKALERISNKYGKIEKLALVVYSALWEGSGGRRDALEGCLFKCISALLFLLRS